MFDFLNSLFGSNRNQNNSNFFKRFSYGNRSSCNMIYKLVSFEKAKEMIENQNDIEKRIFIYEQTKPLMIYCSTGTRSKSAIMNLNRLGYNNIFIWEYAALATFPYKNMLIYNK